MPLMTYIITVLRTGYGHLHINISISNNIASIEHIERFFIKITET